ncbi:hypothetical protein TSUD_293610 [Trifolium subterraneum]|uniref:Uncharacterized protein n=1 Tax=Trifolium subterraneum TaxID=3900 RepID=A0A2Z6MIY9_TRISU|nr:hypothetical protein TSUD_293610 [Trifolium subterraneum]
MSAALSADSISASRLIERWISKLKKEKLLCSPGGEGMDLFQQHMLEVCNSRAVIDSLRLVNRRDGGGNSETAIT